MDAIDFAAEVVRIGGRFLRVPRGTARPLIDRRVSIRGERVRIVADGDVEIALRIESQRAAHMAALLALRRNVN